jgi:glucose-1-phosphate thymidylyltransferase
VSEFVVERMLAGGATRLCFVIAPRKLDIVTYYGASIDGVPICYVVQPEPTGLCDAIFRGLPFAAPDESIAVGLPDTVWFPVGALRTLHQSCLSFLLFPVEDAQFFDAVVTDEQGNVKQLQVKDPAPSSNWIWGAFSAPTKVMQDLHSLWLERARQDEYIGGLVNEYLKRGGPATAVYAGTSYVDVGTVTGYRRAFADVYEPSAATRA